MVCIYCLSDTQVTNSRLQKRANQVWRRRKCVNCGATFSTQESAIYEGAWQVKDSMGRLTPFSRNKLLLSLYKSLEHREHALTEAEALMDTIIGKLLRGGGSQRGLLAPDSIIQTTYSTLQRFDTPASVSYLAFHPLSKGHKQ